MYYQSCIIIIVLLSLLGCTGATGQADRTSSARSTSMPDLPRSTLPDAVPITSSPAPYLPPLSAVPLISKQNYLLLPSPRLSAQEAAKLPFYAAQISALAAPVGFVPAENAPTASLIVDWGTESPYQIYDPAYGSSYATPRDWRSHRAGMWGGSFGNDPYNYARLLTVYPHYVTIQAQTLHDGQAATSLWTVKVLAPSRSENIDLRGLLTACTGHLGRNAQITLPLH